MKILVTGSAGMIGNYVVREFLKKGHSVVGLDRRKSDFNHNDFHQYIIDLKDKDTIGDVFVKEKPDRVIHLAALAHTKGETDLSFERYKLINVTCSENIFKVSESYGCPVLFISTVDAIGMVKGRIEPDGRLNPISNYGRSKAMAEQSLKKLVSRWNIYRFSPVYTLDVKRDIEKRYYLKYPNWAYKIGKGEKFEVLDVANAVDSMINWVGKEVDNTIHIIKDPELLDINLLIQEEKKHGRAKHVLIFPRWMVLCGYYGIKCIFGNSNKTYLVFKALWPFRTLDNDN